LQGGNLVRLFLRTAAAVLLTDRAAGTFAHSGLADGIARGEEDGD